MFDFVPLYNRHESGEERYASTTCSQCGQDYETPDVAHCTFHETPICTQCCTLEKACHDVCKKPLVLGRKPAAVLPRAQGYFLF